MSLDPGSSPSDDSIVAPEALQQLRQSFERFVPLPDDVWDDVRTIWQTDTVSSGDVLTRPGQVEQTFSFILNGLQHLYFLTPDGEEITVAFAYEGDFSGVPDSFFLGKPSTVHLRALTEGRILQASRTDIIDTMDAHPVLDRWAWHLMAWALRGRFEREQAFLTQPALERYRRFLDRSGSLVQRVPLKHVASYLGMTPETLSRVRAMV